MIVGRAIYGTGVISMIYTSSMLINDWLPESKMGWGIYLSVSSLGVMLCSAICPAIFEAVNPTWDNHKHTQQIVGFGHSYISGFYFQIVSAVATFILVAVDKYAADNL